MHGDQCCATALLPPPVNLQRAEHNAGMLSTLEEVALHQQNITRIELLGQLCPKLKIVYLQNNLIGRIENLHKLKASAPAAAQQVAVCMCMQARVASTHRVC